MSPAMGKSGEKIRKIVKFRQMLRRWRRKARVGAGRSEPSDVPAGHVAVIVGLLGGGCRRFVVRASHLNHPVFRRLLVQAEEEYGFVKEGPLTIPCHEAVFEEILRVMESGQPARFVTLEDFQRCCHVGIRAEADLLGESRPLLRGLADESVF